MDEQLKRIEHRTIQFEYSLPPQQSGAVRLPLPLILWNNHLEHTALLSDDPPQAVTLAHLHIEQTLWRLAANHLCLSITHARRTFLLRDNTPALALALALVACRLDHLAHLATHRLPLVVALMARRWLIARARVEDVSSEAMFVRAVASVLCVANTGVGHLAAHGIILVTAWAAFTLAGNLGTRLATAFAPVATSDQLTSHSAAAHLALGKRGTLATVAAKDDVGEDDQEKA